MEPLEAGVSTANALPAGRGPARAAGRPLALLRWPPGERHRTIVPLPCCSARRPVAARRYRHQTLLVAARTSPMGERRKPGRSVHGLPAATPGDAVGRPARMYPATRYRGRVAATWPSALARSGPTGSEPVVLPFVVLIRAGWSATSSGPGGSTRSRADGLNGPSVSTRRVRASAAEERRHIARELRRRRARGQRDGHPGRRGAAGRRVVAATRRSRCSWWRRRVAKRWPSSAVPRCAGRRRDRRAGAAAGDRVARCPAGARPRGRAAGIARVDGEPVPVPPRST